MAILASSEIESTSWRKIGIFWVALSILFWGLISLYLGSTYNPTFYQNQISIVVVNFDTGKKLGEAFRQSTLAHIGGNPQQSPLIPSDHLGATGSIQAGWNLPSSDQYLGNPQKVIDSVRNGEVWGAIMINPGATDALNAAAANPGSPYDPKNALTIVYDEGRNPNTVADFVVRPMRTLANEFQATFSQQWIVQLATGNQSAALPNLASKSPAVLSVPASWTEINIANTNPDSAFVTFAGLSIGLLLLIVFTFAAITIIIDITEEFTVDLSGSTMVSLRMRLAFFYTLTMSLFYSLAMAAFKGSFTPGSWFGFWALHFLHLSVHALTFLTAAVIASPAIQAPLFLLVLVVNIIAGFGTPELANPFYIWEFGIPMYHAVSGSRTLLFGGFPFLAKNYGSLIGWMIGFIITYTFFQLRASDNEDGTAPMQRSGTIHELEKSLTGGLRASRQFSFRDDDQKVERRRSTASRASADPNNLDVHNE
ncbi:hypothetical protein HK099_008624 [Clydaea vesicula]|uniref:DUF3533 domain-containing protein n=1 Tax=Clydaea vesicula TaxID=447962 RepID=A0AAD5U7R7_9FUNG|nr:hypothetical protein HK099_008624 [Clydaea vesicula]